MIVVCYMHVLKWLKHIVCIVNVQHNCAANKCTNNGRQFIRQERETTIQTRAHIQHINEDDVILNTTQQRSAELISQFRVEVPPIDRKKAIHDGAAAKIADQKQRTITKKPIAAEKSQGLQKKRRRTGIA
jgi:hypothetical protein